MKLFPLNAAITLHSATHLQRLNMAYFPKGAESIPNAYNSITGFSIQQYYFSSGFPAMAHPMAEWVLSTYYSEHFHQTQTAFRSIWVYRLAESNITPIMINIEKKYPGIHSFSLPSEGGNINVSGINVLPHIEFGIKAQGQSCQCIDEAWQVALQQLQIIGAELQPHPPQNNV